jgi:hypothetical protein
MSISFQTQNKLIFSDEPEVTNPIKEIHANIDWQLTITEITE